MFPVEVFPEPMADFVRRVAAAVGCPADDPGTAALVVTGTAIGSSRALLLKEGWTERPAMYACLVGPPSSAKTPAIRHIAAPLHRCQGRLVAERREEARRYQAALAEYQYAMRRLEEDGEQPEEPAPPGPLRQLVMNDATVEAMAACLEENPRGVLQLRDELAAWAEGMDMYRGRGNDRRFYLSAWSGEAVKIDRKGTHGEPIWIPRPFISVLGGIQPDLLLRLQARRGDDDGFVARLLFAFPEEVASPPWSDEGVSDDDAAGWAAVVETLLALRPARIADGECVPVVLPLDKGGKAAWVRWFNALKDRINSPDTPEMLRGILGKFRSYCPRFALTLRLLREACGMKVNATVSAADVAGAVKLCDYFEAHAGGLLSPQPGPGGPELRGAGPVVGSTSGKGVHRP